MEAPVARFGAAALLATVINLSVPMPVGAQKAPPVLDTEPESLFLPPHGDEGCWVKFYAGEGYAPPEADLRGRTYIDAFKTGAVIAADLREVGGEAFLRRAQSVVVGPNARLVGYEEEGFGHKVLSLAPGLRVPDLDTIGFHENVRSLKVFCTP